MRAANITTGIAIFLWLCMFLIGRDLAYGVYSHGVGVFPSARQIDYYVVFPLGIAAFLASVGWISNTFRRWPALQLSISMLSIIILLPYLLVYTGGV